MKLLLDFLPLLLFFGTFKYANGHQDWAAAFATDHLGFLVSGGVVGRDEAPVLLATLIVITATIVQVIAMKVMRRKIHLMLWVTLASVVVLGGATVWFHNPTFIKWKPSALYWSMALAFWISDAVFHKNILQSMVDGQIQMPPQMWKRLNLAWIAFFGVMGVINLYVAYNFSTSDWATFKVFGATGLMVVFMVGQMFFLAPHVKEEEPKPADEKRA